MRPTADKADAPKAMFKNDRRGNFMMTPLGMYYLTSRVDTINKRAIQGDSVSGV
jgi:hypothetical protein